MDTRLNREGTTHLYNQTVCSIKASSGTPYDCTQADIDAFHGYDCIVRSVTFLPAEESIQTLTSFLTEQHPTPDIRSALARLRLAAWDPNWGPDVIIKALGDIDKAFFNSRLRGNVKVHWCNSSNETIRGHLGLMIPGVRKGQCTVILNSDTIFAEQYPRKEMWQTTLHELVHAYLHVTSGERFINTLNLYNDHRSFRKHHGWDFCWLLTHVHQRAKEFLNIRLLTGHDRDRVCVHAEWKLIYKDAIRLDKLRLDTCISHSGDGRQRLLGDVIRFRSTPAYYEGLPLGSSEPDGVLRREDKRGTAPSLLSLLYGLDRFMSWLSQT